jgi:hypothetical protein
MLPKKLTKWTSQEITPIQTFEFLTCMSCSKLLKTTSNKGKLVIITTESIEAQHANTIYSKNKKKTARFHAKKKRKVNVKKKVPQKSHSCVIQDRDGVIPIVSGGSFMILEFMRSGYFDTFNHKPKVQTTHVFKRIHLKI